MRYCLIKTTESHCTSKLLPPFSTFSNRSKAKVRSKTPLHFLAAWGGFWGSSKRSNLAAIHSGTKGGNLQRSGIFLCWKRPAPPSVSCPSPGEGGGAKMSSPFLSYKCRVHQREDSERSIGLSRPLGKKGSSTLLGVFGTLCHRSPRLLVPPLPLPPHPSSNWGGRGGMESFWIEQQRERETLSQTFFLGGGREA